MENYIKQMTIRFLTNLEVNISDIEDNKAIINDLSLDLKDVACLLYFIEKEFHVRIDFKDIKENTTVIQLIQLVSYKIKLQLSKIRTVS